VQHTAVLWWPIPAGYIIIRRGGAVGQCPSYDSTSHLLVQVVRHRNSEPNNRVSLLQLLHVACAPLLPLQEDGGLGEVGNAPLITILQFQGHVGCMQEPSVTLTCGVKA
jgi:hypothetical protein